MAYDTKVNMDIQLSLISVGMESLTEGNVSELW